MPRPLAARLSSTRSCLRTVAAALLILGAAPTLAGAQDWGSEDDDWTTGSNASGGVTWSEPPTSGWSLRAGMGFTVDPDDFLLNFELPYRFDQYVSVGPMLQVGLEDDRYIVAPTANLTLTIPNLPGEDFDRFKPNLFAGIGFAVIENEQRGGDNRAAGFLVNAGFGLDYVLSEHLSLGSRMILNFLPERTLDESFFYAWEIIGVKVSF